MNCVFIFIKKFELECEINKKVTKRYNESGRRKNKKKERKELFAEL